MAIPAGHEKAAFSNTDNAGCMLRRLPSQFHAAAIWTNGATRDVVDCAVRISIVVSCDQASASKVAFPEFRSAVSPKLTISLVTIFYFSASYEYFLQPERAEMPVIIIPVQRLVFSRLTAKERAPSG